MSEGDLLTHEHDRSGPTGSSGAGLTTRPNDAIKLSLFGNRWLLTRTSTPLTHIIITLEKLLKLGLLLSYNGLELEDNGLYSFFC